MPQVRLTPEALPKLKVGDRVMVQAIVDNAQPEHQPFRYAWTGVGQARPESLRDVAQVALVPDKPGKYTLGVSVSGPEYELGSASIEYEVAEVQVKVERVPNAAAPIPVGGTLRFKASLSVDGKPAQGNYIYRWQPNSALDFRPTESAQASQTSAVFTQLGRQPVWVEVLERRGDSLTSVARSDNLDIEVIQPRFSLSATPNEPLVGQETRVTLKDEPRLDDKIAGVRWEHRGDALTSGPAQDERTFTFKPKNVKPVTVKARGYLRDGSADLGETEIAIQPRAYDVKVNAPRARGSQPKVWKCDTQLGGAAKCGMVDIPQGQFVTFQDIFIQSAIAPPPPAPRYRWTVDPSGSCGLPGSGSELRLNCGNTGSYTVKLEVTDADGAELGTAETSVSVSLSQDSVKSGTNKAQAGQKLDEARQLWNQGKHDEAVAAAEAAARIDKDLAMPVLGQFSQGLKQQGWDALNKGDRDTAIKRLEQAVRLNPNDADANKKLADARDHVARWPQVEAKVRVFDDHIANQRIWSAQREMLAMQDILRTMAAGQSSSNPTWKRVMDDFNKGLRDYTRFTQEKSVRHTQYFKEENYPEMLRNAESMRERELSPADERECQSRIDFAKRYLKAIEQDPEAVGVGALLTGKTFNCVAVDASSAKRWPCTIKFGGTPGNVTGELSWTSLGSVHRIAGSLTGESLRFTETAAIKTGGAHLNVNYTLTRSGNRLTGNYQDPADRSTGSFNIDLSAVGTGTTANVTGTWMTTEGQLTLLQNGNQVTGNYSQDGGRITGVLNGKVLEGYWSETDAGQRCASARDGRHFWGRIRWDFESNRFVGGWSYCDQAVPADGQSWKGERTGAAPHVIPVR
ncbi:MAG: tetratricopeptide repeat protein [Hydrogenophilales bacterium]|nr:tetratricopeptide repeat protein [Hydrogenophilales bacterium]